MRISLLIVVLGWCLEVWLCSGLKLRRFFATTISGFEEVLRSEIAVLPEVSSVRAQKLGVYFEGPTSVGFHAVLRLRVALRIYEELAHMERGLESVDDLYYFVKQGACWDDLISSESTLKSDCVLSSSVHPSLCHSHFSALTIKNAICDFLVEKHGARPNIDKEDPDCVITGYFSHTKSTLYRVWSGPSSLHKRGYRANAVQHKAALRETTAAGLCYIAGWDSLKHELIDPMCGSGSIVIEAALIAAGTAPGLVHPEVNGPGPKFLFKDVDLRLWTQAKEEAIRLDQRKKLSGVLIHANDVSESAISLAKMGARKAVSITLSTLA